MSQVDTWKSMKAKEKQETEISLDTIPMKEMTNLSLFSDVGRKI